MDKVFSRERSSVKFVKLIRVAVCIYSICGVPIADASEPLGFVASGSIREVTYLDSGRVGNETVKAFEFTLLGEKYTARLDSEEFQEVVGSDGGDHYLLRTLIGDGVSVRESEVGFVGFGRFPAEGSSALQALFGAMYAGTGDWAEDVRFATYKTVTDLAKIDIRSEYLDAPFRFISSVRSYAPGTLHIKGPNGESVPPIELPSPYEDGYLAWEIDLQESDAFGEYIAPGLTVVKFRLPKDTASQSAANKEDTRLTTVYNVHVDSYLEPEGLKMQLLPIPLNAIIPVVDTRVPADIAAASDHEGRPVMSYQITNGVWRLGNNEAVYEEVAFLREVVKNKNRAPMFGLKRIILLVGLVGIVMLIVVTAKNK